MKMSKKILSVLLTTTMLTWGYTKPSKEPPAGIAVEKCPMFVSIGFDDNGYPDAMEWFRNFLQDKTNPQGQGNGATFDGTPVRVSFYVNAKYGDLAKNPNGEAVIDAWKSLYEDGHEIGNHTYNHDYMAAKDSVAQAEEIRTCSDFLESKVSIPRQEITGFRAPYLNYNNTTISNVVNEGILYDCSIEHSLEGDGTDFYWPYMLDEGSVSPIVSVNVGSFPGTWEVPMNEVIIPEEHTNGQWHGLTGLDYNMWISRKMTKEAFLATLKYTLDQRLAGNRAPFTFGAHSDYYSTDKVWDNWAKPVASLEEMREVFEEFINYALTKPDVRIVPVQKIIDWMKNPVALDGSTAITHVMRETTTAAVQFRKTNEGILLSLPIDGTFNVEIYSHRGRLLSKSTIQSTQRNLLLSNEIQSLGYGTYIVRIQNSATSFVKQIVW